MNKLRQVRKSKGLTLKQVAQSVGISEDLIGKYERGERNPKIETSIKLADYYSVPIEYLVEVPNELEQLLVGHDKGHTDGHNDGYGDGYSDGYEDGIRKGIELGRKQILMEIASTYGINLQH